MFKFLQSMFGKKSVEVKQPEFHEEIRAQVEAGKVEVEISEPAPAVKAKAEKKPAAKKAGAKKAPAKSAEKKPAKKPAKKSK